MTKEKLLKLLEPFDDGIRIFRSVGDDNSVSIEDLIYTLKQDTKEPLLVLR